ncbi:DUF3108 domain-containing protein [Paracrocinitomix mangrovi]|uniref:DUF3108 domain-containing protein n=1 Tax=Paracrocinitomix mangrovi TaxID=2862509 RepID=UPI001C8D35B5|nr:DUF3108 domain-containing protein [Paracrocinitomix mangrovi]UKN01340.1 DUF3108 domain-containing protein [Paracrocinitomix mangrovi]
MKTRILAIVAVFILITSFTYQVQNDCSPYFPLKKGTSWEYENFDKKGELEGTDKTTVLDIIAEGEKIIYKLKGEHDGAKKKEKDHFERDFEYTCEDGQLKMSVDHLIPQETRDGMKDMDIVMEQSEMSFPKELKVGDALPDSWVTMKVSTNGMQIMSMRVDVTNRKVVKEEEITTKAGTFKCLLISYDSKTDMGMMKTESSTKEWYSPKVGMVQSEFYDKKGELSSTRKLLKFTEGS